MKEKTLYTWYADNPRNLFQQNSKHEAKCRNSTTRNIFEKHISLRYLESSAATPHTENEMLQSEDNANIMGSCQNFCVHFNKVGRKKKKKEKLSLRTFCLSNLCDLLHFWQLYSNLFKQIIFSQINRPLNYGDQQSKVLHIKWSCFKKCTAPIRALTAVSMNFKSV